MALVVLLLAASSSGAVSGEPTGPAGTVADVASTDGVASPAGLNAGTAAPTPSRAAGGSAPGPTTSASDASTLKQKNKAALEAALTTTLNSTAGGAPPRALTAAPAASSCPVSSGVASCTFEATGTTGLFNVPIGVSSLTATLTGASSAGAAYGAGGQLQVLVPVSAGQSLSLAVGVAGGGTTGGFPDGGNASTTAGNTTGCAGGGGSRISFQGGADIAEAGGGGGCGGDGSGDSAGGQAGSGGNPGGSGQSGTHDCAGSGGGGGSSTGNGGGGSGYTSTCIGVYSHATGGNSGSGHTGGDGGAGSNKYRDGGGSGAGGGGGWFGGGGGGGGGQHGGSGGGGGGGSNGWNSSLATQQGPNSTGVNAGDGSIVLSYPVNSTTTTLSLSPAVQTVGGQVTVTATVAAGTNPVAAAGVNVALQGAGDCDSLTLTATGSGTCTFTAGALGSSSIAGVFPTTGAYLASTSAAATLTVNPGPTTTAVGAITTTPTTATVPVTVALAGQTWGTIVGTISASTAGGQHCSVPVQSAVPETSVQASCTVTGLTAGSSNTLTVSYASTDGNTVASTATGTATQALFATSVSAALPAAATYGTPLAVTTIVVQATDATALGGTVTVYDSPASATPVSGKLNIPAGAVPLCSDLTVTTTGGGSFAPPTSGSCQGQPLPGTTYLIATYSGDAQSQPSQSAAQTLQTQPAATSIALTGTTGGNPVPQSVLSDTPITLTAAVSYGSPAIPVTTPSVTFYDGSAQVCPTTTGTCQVRPTVGTGATHTYTAVFTGQSGRFNPSPTSNTLVVNVTAPSSSLAISASASTVPAGQSATLTVAFSTANTTAPTGTVSIFSTADPSEPVCTPGPLVKNQFSCPVSPSPGSTTNYSATYTGDLVYGTVVTTANASVVVSPAGSTLVMNAVIANYGSPATLSATVTSVSSAVTPTGTITFTSDGNALCSATLTSSSAGSATGSCTTGSTALHVGNPPIVAGYAGSATVGGSVAVGITPVIAAEETATTLTAALVGFQTASLTATVTATSGSGVVTGTVAFANPDKTPVTGCTAVVVSAGAATCPVHNAPTVGGSYVYTASFTGTANSYAKVDNNTSSGSGTLMVQTGSCTGGFLAFYNSLSASSTPTLGSGFASLPLSVTRPTCPRPATPRRPLPSLRTSPARPCPRCSPRSR